MINRATENALEVYKVNRKADGWISGIAKAVTFPKVSNHFLMFDNYLILFE